MQRNHGPPLPERKKLAARSANPTIHTEWQIHAMLTADVILRLSRHVLGGGGLPQDRNMSQLHQIQLA